jgi:hypothetical protein
VTEALAEEDRLLLERLASRVVELKLETPALLTLETARPLSLLAGQAMLFFEPFAQALFHLTDYRRIAALIERREAIAVLIEQIEHAADERERAGRTK